MRASGSAKTEAASTNVMPCFRRFERALRVSHSKAGAIIPPRIRDWAFLANSRGVATGSRPGGTRGSVTPKPLILLLRTTPAQSFGQNTALPVNADFTRPRSPAIPCTRSPERLSAHHFGGLPRMSVPTGNRSGIDLRVLSKQSSKRHNFARRAAIAAAKPQ